ncbi:HIT family protein [Deinococcus metallilatus]|uniref:HIT family protein n=1 Tax=Deinococcus metallilatus TaxID=1211322 RepID=A0AAJ5F5V3_9DEIO|nr:HIT family protein [Deinococcus metallilatus]MBB5297091.1 histidine triad (HIT) family protein [Deinococcus metallilatus]QBY07783.1 HIT family protein [Deinococcus metallilatus]RXJ13483.1 HIT family protein [Deinococcus metallilatus]TLK22360.1 HIT family protein [Deinococcus metallilatus]GMA17344.1 hypothetical protein GCM10025871_36750 [Deinococcus metallilatus]
MIAPSVTHAPPGYPCPFCLLAAGIVNEHVWSRESDIVYRDEWVMAFIAAKQWAGTLGHVLIVPVAHFENLYTLPDELGARIHALSRRVALAMKAAYGCAGVSTRQHNEPAGQQDVWHCWPGDDLYGTRGSDMPPGERAGYAAHLRAHLS